MLAPDGWVIYAIKRWFALVAWRQNLPSKIENRISAWRLSYFFPGVGRRHLPPVGEMLRGWNPGLRARDAHSTVLWDHRISHVKCAIAKSGPFHCPPRVFHPNLHSKIFDPKGAITNFLYDLIFFNFAPVVLFYGARRNVKPLVYFCVSFFFWPWPGKMLQISHTVFNCWCLRSGSRLIQTLEQLQLSTIVFGGCISVLHIPLWKICVHRTNPNNALQHTSELFPKIFWPITILNNVRSTSALNPVHLAALTVTDPSTFSMCT